MNIAATAIEPTQKVTDILNFDLLRKDCKIEVSYPKTNENSNEIDHSEIHVSVKYTGEPANIGIVANALEAGKIGIFANTAGALMALGYQVDQVSKTHDELKQQFESGQKDGFISLCYIAKKA